MVHTQALAVAAAALLAALPVNAGLYPKSSKVIQLDSKNYDRLIAQSNYTSVRPLDPAPYYPQLITTTDRRILRPMVRTLQESPTRIRESRRQSTRPGKSSSHRLR